jgi:hypothetical protein
MKKFQEALYNLALSDLPSANAADTLYRSSKDLNDDELAVWVMNNMNELQKVLQVPSVMDDNVSDWMRDMAKEVYSLRNEATTASRDEQRDIMGNKRRSVDDYMTAFGYQTENGKALSDDDRSAFTNPENKKYWGNYPQSEKEAAAVALGNDRFSEIEDDLRRSGDEYQLRNQGEGYNANNELEVWPWLKSALKGAATPRVKEAQLAGREPTWQDFAGDAAELGLNFIPGVGIADKAGVLIYKAPWLTSDMAKAIGEKIAFGAGFATESLAQPLASQALDVGVLYNPDVLGEPTSSLNPRSEFSKDKLLAQAGGIGMGKGVVKGYGARVKNSLEQSLGDDAAGAAYKGGFKDFIGNLGNKTDDIIARRQAMLDRKAELAKQNAELAKKVELGNAPVKRSGYSIDDLIDAENYRALTSEAKRLGSSQGIANKYANNPDDNWLSFRNKNEAGKYDNLVQLPDGRVISAKNLDEEGIVIDGVHKKVDDVTPLEYQYDDVGNMDMDVATRIDDMGGVIDPDHYDFDYISRTEDGFPNVTSRNAVVKEQINRNPELARKMAGATRLGETARDASANAVYNMLAREGYANAGGMIGSIKEIDEKRQKALWNNMLGKLRDFTANPRISVEDRAKYADAIMNVMTYGLDGLTDEQYAQYPQIYHNIAIKLGVDEWKHPSEYTALSTDASSSTAMPMSSSSMY